MMKISEFEKTIQYEELVKSRDSIKFMYKSYLDCLLKGDRLRANCLLYSLGKTEAICLEEGSPLEIYQEMELIELFKKIMQRGYWETEQETIEEFDENGKLIPIRDRLKDVIISKKIITKVKRIYYLSDERDIKPLKGEN